MPKIRKVLGIVGMTFVTLWVAFIVNAVPLTYIGPKGVALGVWLILAGTTFLGMIFGQLRIPFGGITFAATGLFVIACVLEQNLFLYFPTITMILFILVFLLASMDFSIFRDLRRRDMVIHCMPEYMRPQTDTSRFELMRLMCFDNQVLQFRCDGKPVYMIRWGDKYYLPVLPWQNLAIELWNCASDPSSFCVLLGGQNLFRGGANTAKSCKSEHCIELTTAQKVVIDSWRSNQGMSTEPLKSVEVGKDIRLFCGEVPFPVIYLVDGTTMLSVANLFRGVPLDGFGFKGEKPFSKTDFGIYRHEFV